MARAHPFPFPTLAGLHPQDQAKFLPSAFFKCKPTPTDDLEESDLEGSDLSKKGGGDDKKPSCQDMKGRKDCIKSKAVCSWCENKYGPTMCIGEVRGTGCLGRWGPWAAGGQVGCGAKAARLQSPGCWEPCWRPDAL